MVTIIDDHLHKHPDNGDAALVKLIVHYHFDSHGRAIARKIQLRLSM